MTRISIKPSAPMIVNWHINDKVRYHVETSKDGRCLFGFDGAPYVTDAGLGYVDQIEKIELACMPSMSAILRVSLDFELTNLS